MQEGQIDPIIRTGEPTIAIPTDIQPTIPPEYWGTDILAIAILIRSVASLVQVLTPLILRQRSGSSKK